MPNNPDLGKLRGCAMGARTSPFCGVKAPAGKLQRAGSALITVKSLCTTTVPDLL